MGHKKDSGLPQAGTWLAARQAVSRQHSEPHDILETAIETSSVLSVFMEEKWPKPFFVGVPRSW
ncbi:hypothetical protein ABFP37_19345 [Burkholderia sp. RS01]|uniref:hypothetical protein n=1 Tax=unclassified Burkholderia TaxID=2613784 RepID=UPI00321872EB